MACNRSLINECDSTNTAAYFCDSLVLNGYDDWYLPSSGELGALVAELNFRVDIENADEFVILNGNYWSSTQVTSLSDLQTSQEAMAGYSSNLNTSVSSENKNNAYPIMPIRAFNTITNNLKTICNIGFANHEISGHITVDPVTNSSTNVMIEYIGEEIDDAIYNWDFLQHPHFGQAEIISGSGKGPLEVSYNYGANVNARLEITGGGCVTPVFESERFRVNLFEKIPLSFPSIYNGDVKWCDYNNDGLLDAIVTGSDTTQLYKNMDNDIFIPVETTFPNLKSSYCSWGDFNNDGLSDLLICGLVLSDSTRVSALYKNEGNDLFTEQNNSFPGVSDGFMDWLDFDNDGAMDILISGRDNNSAPLTELYKNEGDGNFNTVETDLPSLLNSAVAFDDFNADNFVDLIILGKSGDDRFTEIYKNINGEFTAIDFSPMGLDNGSVDWADVNNDGLLDFAITGNRNDVSIEFSGNAVSVNSSISTWGEVNKNNGDETFSPVEFNRFAHSGTEFGDYDNDGDDDILAVGMISAQWISVGIGGGADYVHRSLPEIMNNFGGDHFPRATPHLPNVNYLLNMFEGSAITFGDYNNDGRLDVLREGRNNGETCAIYKNGLITFNEAPEPPAALTSIVSCDSILLSWNSSLDDHTPEASITYEFYLGTSPNSGDLFSKNNTRKLRTTYFVVDSLPDGIYYWSVKAVDNGSGKSDYAMEQTFEVACGISAINDPSSAYEIQVSPNPFLEEILISVNGTDKTVEYEIVNQFGKKMEAGSFTNSRIISNKTLVPGIYFLNLTIGGESFTRKVIKLE